MKENSIKITTNIREFYIKKESQLFIFNKNKKIKVKKLRIGDFISCDETIKKIESSDMEIISENTEAIQTNTLPDFVKEMQRKYKEKIWDFEKEKKLMSKHNIVLVEPIMAGIRITNIFSDSVYVSGEVLDAPFIDNVLKEIDERGIKKLRNGVFES